MQKPDEGGGEPSDHKAVEDGREERRSEEPLGPDQGVHDTLGVVGLEQLAGPLARGVGLFSCDVVEPGGEDPVHHAVVDDETDNVGDDLNADHVAWWNVKVVADLRERKGKGLVGCPREPVHTMASDALDV